MIPSAKAGGLQIASPTWQAGSRRVRLHDGSPARDVLRRVGISTLSVGAICAVEVVPSGTVPLVDVPAAGTFPRCVAGIHQNDRYASQGGLVPDELAQLVERPGVQVGALSPTNRYPIADTAQVFELDPTTGAFGYTDECLGDAVVDVPRVAGLLTAAFLQQPSGGFGAEALQFGLQPIVAPSYGPDAFAGVDRAVGVGGEVDHAEVDAEPAGWFATGGWFGDIDDHGEVPLAVAVDQIRLPTHGGTGGDQPSALIDDGDDGPASQSQDGDGVAALPRQDPLVVLHRAERPERGPDVLVPLVRLTRLRDGADGHLRGQPIPLAQGGVDERLKPDLVGGAVLERHPGNMVSGGVTRPHGRIKRRNLLRRRCKFQQLRHQHPLSLSFNAHLVDWRSSSE
jgi:hypothetical protein